MAARIVQGKGDEMRSMVREAQAYRVVLLALLPAAILLAIWLLVSRPAGAQIPHAAPSGAAMSDRLQLSSITNSTAHAAQVSKVAVRGGNQVSAIEPEGLCDLCTITSTVRYNSITAVYDLNVARDITHQSVGDSGGATSTPTNGPAHAQTPTPRSMSFSEVRPSDYFHEAVRYLYCRGVVSGYVDGTAIAHLRPPSVATLPAPLAPQTRTKTVRMAYAPLCTSCPIIEMQATPCEGLAGHPYFISYPNGDQAMQHQDPTKPDNSRHFSQIGPSLTLKLQIQHALTLLSPLTIHLNLTLSRLPLPLPQGSALPVCFQVDFDFDTALPHFVTSLVTNNGLFMRKIPFVTAPSL